MQSAPCQGPDPNPRSPRVSPPVGSTDTHFHVLGPTSKYEYALSREYTPPDATPLAASHLFETLGIQRAVLIQPSVYGEDNARLIDAARELPISTRLVPVVRSHTPEGELLRLHERGARAMRFILAHEGGTPLSELEPLVDRIQDLGWHCQFLLRPDHILELETRLASLKVDAVIDHIGLIRPSQGGIAQPAFQSLLRLIRRGRCWVKLTGGYRISSEEPPYRDVIPLVSALLLERPDRILWGTDWPHVMVTGAMPNTTELLDLLWEWVPDEDLRTQILVRNPAELFQFEAIDLPPIA